MDQAHGLGQALESFAELIDQRIKRGACTTEDSVRYTFFVALTAALGIAPDELVLEQAHPRIRGAEIDTFIPDLGGRAVAVEFKYDRAVPSEAIRGLSELTMCARQSPPPHPNPLRHRGRRGLD